MESLLIHIRDGLIKTLEENMLSALLAGVDKLIAMLDDIGNSNDMDVSEEITELQVFLDAIASGESTNSIGEVDAPNTPVIETSSGALLIDTGGNDIEFNCDSSDILSIPAGHSFLYIVNCPDKELKRIKTTAKDLKEELNAMGSIIVDNSEGESVNVLFSSVLEGELVALSLELDSNNLIQVIVNEDAIGDKTENNSILVDVNGTPVFLEFDHDSVDNIPAGHSYLYVIKCSINDLREKVELEADELMEELTAMGTLIHAKEDELDGVEFLFSTVLEEDLLTSSVGLTSDHITQVIVDKDGTEKNEELDAMPQEAEVIPKVIENDDSIPGLQVTPEMAKTFVGEALDQLETVETAFLDMEKNPDGVKENVAEAFRLIHSFKGNCGLFGLTSLGRLSHILETMLTEYKDKTIAVPQAVIKEFLKALDLLQTALDGFEANGSKTDDACDAFAQELEQSVLGNIKVETKPAVAGVKKAVKKKKASPKAKSKVAPAKKVTRQDIRVDLEKLDRLINLAGELVIAEDMVVKHPKIIDLEDQSLERAIHLLRRVSSELREVAMSARMIPLATTFRKMNRLVHDVSQKAGKNALLEIRGEDTEVDKTVIELIGDPLVHIVRNSVDHGLETPKKRLELGKNPQGKVSIEARHEGGEVWITISDDGQGLQKDRIVEKAIENGLISENDDLPDEEIFKLIFEAGFSTAAAVTDISGRGVGMDVVKKNIEKLKGQIDITSKEGEGSSVIIRIPLTLAIIEGMLVRVGDAMYTIPLLSIRESIRPVSEQINALPDGKEFLRLREDIIPIIRLYDIFKIKADITELTKANLVILEHHGNLIALCVDELLGQHETVIKGLSDYIGDARGVSGCTVLGSGEVSLIIDIAGLLEMTDNK
jgi:two-component system chemotaxis sensor kinase CheA